MTQQECYQLLGRTTQVFREEYLQKQDLAQQAIQKRVRILTNLKETQSNDLDYLSQLKADMHDRAGELGVKCDECQDKNDEILKRIESIMRKLQARLPVLSEAERTMKRELETMHDKLESYKTNLQQLEIKQKYQKRQIDNQKNNSVSSPVLKDTQLKQIKDTMRKEVLTRYGPNGELRHCFKYLLYFAQNLDWLDEVLEEVEDDYILFDLPGQIELYTHIPVMKQLVDKLQRMDFRICGTFLIDSQFMIEASKFVSGVLTALSTMVTLEIPHVNVMTKLDLLSKKAKKDLERYLEPDLPVLLNEEFDDSKFSNKFKKLNTAIASVIEDYSLVKFVPLDMSEEDSITDLLLQIDNAIQYGEDLEPKESNYEEAEPNDYT
ncbi:uncharacterized protein MGAL_10B067716 [Mytilus galloprovincialis]|uniref:GPN-loop GTPase 3 n=1 Tax=Mytilus galloprovincialis TaxID=29158 RepID=A0A8B6E2A0_MYTGA|nr:uncharacterized protein MGAL_10B067716 [Mytilus galloprovincialis]